MATQEAVPGTQMPTLAEVFELADRYGANSVQFNIETKLDPTLPNDTVAPATFARKVIAVITRYNMTKRSLLQSFDWRTLVAARKLSRACAASRSRRRRRSSRARRGRRHRDRADPFDGGLARVVADKLDAHVLSPDYTDLTDG